MIIKKIIETLWGKRVEMEDYVRKEIDILLRFSEIFIEIEKSSEIKNRVDDILALELEFNEVHEEMINQARDSRYLTIRWEDVYTISTSLKHIFFLYNSYYNKSVLFSVDFPHKNLFTMERQILKHIRTFLEHYRDNHNYVSEVLKNTTTVIRDFSRYCFELIASDRMKTSDSAAFGQMAYNLDEINSENEKIQNTLNKIFICAF